MIPFFVLVVSVPNGDDEGAVMLLLRLLVPPVPPRTLLPQAALVVVRHKSAAALLAVVSLISLSLSTIISSIKVVFELSEDSSSRRKSRL